MSRLGDFTTTPRVVPISLLAAGVGALSAFLAVALLRMIAFFTNLFFFQRFSLATASPADHRLGIAVVLVPILGGLVTGLMAASAPKNPAVMASRKRSRRSSCAVAGSIRRSRS